MDIPLSPLSRFSAGGSLIVEGYILGLLGVAVHMDEFFRRVPADPSESGVKQCL